MVIVASLIVFVSANLLLFGAPWTAGWLAALAAVIAARRRAPIAAVLVIGAVGWTTPLHEYADRTEALAAKETWSHRDRAGVWVLNAGMAITGAAIGFPEVALETTLLALPGPPHRRFDSAFPSHSPQVRAVIDDWKESIDPDGRSPVILDTETIRWTYRESSWRELRSGLALDAFTLTGTAAQGRDGWELMLCGEVNVSYPQHARLPLGTIGGRSIVIDEGLFWRLQQEGWMWPYVAQWCWREPLL
jgi:hypothetical protein